MRTEAVGGDDARCIDAQGDARKKLLTPSLRRHAARWAVREKGYSQRRACRLVGLHPKTYRYVTKRSGDEELRRRLRELASQRRRQACLFSHIASEDLRAPRGT